VATIAVGGFQHETNTFAPVPADLGAFEQADAWPGLVRGEAMLEATADINLPVAGFVARARDAGHRLVPLAWCSATPSGAVTEQAFETVCGMLVEGLRGARGLDAVYLDLHGAMVAEHAPDGDAEILRRVRDVVGNLPLVASLDLHANVSREMVERASALVAFRTYPHVDMAETGARAAALLEALIARAPGAGRRPARAWRRMPFLIPITSQCTMVEPGASLMALAASLEGDAVDSVAFTPGFPAADFADCGPAVTAFGREEGAVGDAVDRLAGAVLDAEADFRTRLWSAADAVRHALAAAPRARGPIVLADTQDNPGGGGTGDTVGLLRALLDARAAGAVLGLLHDPGAAAAAHERGEGARIEVALGARAGSAPGETPVPGPFRVERLGDGRITATGPYYRGSRMELGPMALLERGGVRVAVASRNQQAADRAMFRHLGVEPAAVPVVALKSSVHFRADFAPIAAEILVVESPGANVADPAQLAYRHLRPGLRVAGGPALPAAFAS